MLTTNKNITLQGSSTIDGKEVLHFSCVISANVKNAPVNVRTVRPDVYEANLAECRADRDAFEDLALELKAQVSGETKEAEDETD